MQSDTRPKADQSRSRRICPASFRTLALAAFCAVTFLVGGCATLPRPVPVDGPVATKIRDEFKVMLQEQKQCPAAFDSDVTVTVDNLLWSGTLSGYLRAMAPSFVRFEGINPLGLTEAILAVDGQKFTYLSVREQQAYTGPLTAERLDHYAPDGLATSMSYYWLLGRIPPGALGLGEVGRDRDGQGYWLDLRNTATGKRSKILFTPEQHLIKRHLIVNGDDAVILDLAYEYPQPATPSDCELPDKITIQGRRGNGTLSLGFTKRYPAPALDRAPFEVTAPAEYTRTVVQ